MTDVTDQCYNLAYFESEPFSDKHHLLSVSPRSKTSCCSYHFSCVYLVILLMLFVFSTVFLLVVLDQIIGYVNIKDQRLDMMPLKLKYNMVSYATTHNSYAVLSDGIIASNQRIGIAQSLKSGIRALMLDLHFTDNSNSSIALCHGDCSIGSVNIELVLEIIANFLDEYPQNIITILWETTCKVNCKELKHMLYSMVEKSRLTKTLYVPSSISTTWPTLGEMVQDNTKIVQFFDNPPHDIGWDIPMWENIVDTPYDNKNKNNLDTICTFSRGSPSNSLFLINHFTLLGLSLPILTTSYNNNPYLYNRITRCMRELDKFPNFIAVDFFSFSDVIKTVNCMNSNTDTVKRSCSHVQQAQSFVIGGVSILLISVLGMISCCVYSYYTSDSDEYEVIPTVKSLFEYKYEADL